MTDMATRQRAINALTTTHGMTIEQVALVKATVAKGASDDELRLFIAVAGRTGLDPFTRQIHFVKRWDSKLKKEVGAIQTGIDGYRLIASRTGQYAGQDAPEWCGEDGKWTDVWLDPGPPAAARVSVFRKDVSRAFVGIARWKAYCQYRQGGEPNSMWERMDAEQLAKCAEALALRKAFPQDLAGLYTDDEMEQAATVLADEAPAGAVVQPGKGMAGLARTLKERPRGAAEAETAEDAVEETDEVAGLGDSREASSNAPVVEPTPPEAA